MATVVMEPGRSSAPQGPTQSSRPPADKLPRYLSGGAKLEAAIRF